MVLSARAMRSALLWLLAPCFCSRLLKSGGWVFFVSLYLFGPGFALRTDTIIFSPIPFLCTLSWRRDVSWYRHCSIGANSPRSQVPACLNGISPITSFELYALRVGKGVTLNWKEWTLAAVSYTKDSPWR